MKEFAELIGRLGISFLVFLYGSGVRGFLLLKYYIWFMIPVSPLFPNINYLEAVGIMVFTLVFRKTDLSDKAEEHETTGSEYFRMIAFPWLLLGLGYLIHLII